MSWSRLDSVEKLSSQTVQKDLRGKAREKSTSAGVLVQYVGARRSSATKPMRLFQQSVEPDVSVFGFALNNRSQRLAVSLEMEMGQHAD
jgi:hypothetical protein